MSEVIPIEDAQDSKYKLDLYGKKTYRFRNLQKWKGFNKKQLTLHEMQKFADAHISSLGYLWCRYLLH